jgi:hypothetical protein
VADAPLARADLSAAQHHRAAFSVDERAVEDTVKQSPFVTLALEQEHSVVEACKRNQANKLATALIHKGKPFSVEPVPADDDRDRKWLFTIHEANEVGGLAGRWADA